MKKINYDYYLNKLIINQNNNLKNYILNNGQSIWIRKAKQHNYKINYIALNLLAKIFNIPILQSCYIDSYQAIQDEINMIQNLTKNNINAPKLLAYNNFSLMTLDFSNSFLEPLPLDHHFKKIINNKQSIIPILELTIKELFNLHSKNQYLSQAFLRNIMLDKNKKFIFFDFEEDPGRKFTIYECQVRDCLFFILSSSYLLHPEFNKVCIYWNNYIISRPETFQKIFSKAIKKFLKINSYNFFNYLGKDGKNFYYALKFIQMYTNKFHNKLTNN